MRLTTLVSVLSAAAISGCGTVADEGQGDGELHGRHDASVAHHDADAATTDTGRPIASDAASGPDSRPAATDASTHPDAARDATAPTDAARDATAPTDAARDATAPTDTARDATAPTDAGRAIWHPAPGTSWQWQLSGTIDTTVDAQMFDIDLFDVPQATVDALHARGRTVICYFDLAYEPGRPDSATFPRATLGNEMDGWPGEHWVDIRSSAILDIMLARMDLAVSRHCDGIEPDNIDAVTNDPGFPFTAADQLAYARTLAREAHARGLSIALKNDLDQVDALVGDFDFSVNEQCFQYNECGVLAAFTSRGKAVFETEYGAASLATSVCPRARTANLDTLIKHLDLDAWRVSCR